MIKDIRYTGHSARPSDYESPDGELAAAVNLIPEDGALHPILPAQVPYVLPDEKCKVVFIHQGSSFKHCIVLDYRSDENNDIYIRYFNFSYTPSNPPVIIPDTYEGFPWFDGYIDSAADPFIFYKIAAVGNILTVLTSQGMYYYYWNGSQYLKLGTKLPEPRFAFSLAEQNFVKSEKIRIDNVVDSTGSQATIEGTEVCTSAAMYQILKVPYDNNESSPLFITDSTEQTVYSDIIKSRANKLFAEKVTGKGMFCFPFFVRYALRLYDDTLVMHSAPILMLPSQFFAYVEEYGSSGITYDIYVGGYPCKLQCCGLNTIGSQWRDIIKSVDIFVSAPIYDYDYAGKCKRLLGGNFTRTEVCKENGVSTYEVMPGHSSVAIIGVRGEFNNKHLATLPQFSSEDFYKKIPDTSNFYLLKTIPFNELSYYYVAGNTWRQLSIPDDYLETLTSRELMTDDYQSHDTLIPNYAYNFNGRLNISGITRKLFNGFDLYTAVCYNNEDNDQAFRVFVEIATDEGTVILHRDAHVGIEDMLMSGLTWLFYPDPKAKRIIIRDSGGSSTKYYELPLKSHEYLNGAYYYNNLSGPSTFTPTTPPEDTEKNSVSVLNKLYTSEINNPFYFPLLGINTAGTGEILGMAAAVKPLSQGQAGQFPLYAFTTEGVWALTPDREGKFITSTPATLDVCINPESITQTEDSVLFATARGIMILTGNKAVCITEILDGKVAGPLEGLPTGHAATIISLAESKGLLSGSLNFVPFMTYIASARLIYDYTHQRIILYNPSDSYNYAYVFSLESKSWGMMATNLVDSVNSYPNALAMDNNRHLIDLSMEKTVEVVGAEAETDTDTSQEEGTSSDAPSDTTNTQGNPVVSPIGEPTSTDGPGEQSQPGEQYGGSEGDSEGDTTDEPGEPTEDTEADATTAEPIVVPAVLVTRPLKLDLPDVLKTIDRVIQRGHFDIHSIGHTPIQSILYGSRDGYTWHMVKSSTDHQLRGFSGTPYKYFKIVLLCTLYANESLNGATISVTPRYTNRIR